MYLEKKENISISKCKEIDTLNGKRRILIDLAEKALYDRFLESFQRRDNFYIQNQRIYISLEGIADNYEQVKELVSKLKGNLVTGKSYQSNPDLVVSECNLSRFHIEQTDEFTELYESLKKSSSNHEANLRKEVESILNTLYPPSTSNSETIMTCLKSGREIRF